MIYFIQQQGGIGPIKIGQSCSPSLRIKQLMSDTKLDLVVLVTAPGDFMTERNLHLKFEAFRCDPPFKTDRPYNNGGPSEWFSPSAELLGYIADVRSSGIIALTKDEQRELRIAERYLGGETLQAIGDDFGVTRERVRQILRNTGVESLGARPSHTRRVITIEIEKQIVALAKSGVPQADIARRLGLKPINVSTYVRKHRIAVPRAKKGHSAEVLAKASAIAADYLAGIKTADIAAKHGLAYQPEIYRFLKVAGVAPGRFSDVAELPADMVRRYEEGASARLIADTIGVDPSKVRQMLIAQGIPVRGHAQSVSVSNARRRHEQVRVGASQ